ncbi:chemotaxis protein CheX [Rubellimicrobium arenae]|uniref:chemotaxis protein CheX n=1 Tax=Rubellimicrobium arenae TaxID=2817372 RepID=UPI001B302D26|nr:chemotaxis protein CheX [Rubellimicrobium arenae]
MSGTLIELDELERDALAELANMGVGRAAANLARMVGGQVLLSVPAVEVVTRARASALAMRGNTGSLVAVQQNFVGPFSGQAVLVFPEANSLELVRAVVGEAVPLEDVADLEQEAVAEIGNVVLNGCLATMANVLRQRLDMSLPEVMRTTDAELFGGGPAEQDGGLVLFLFIDFRVRDRDIQGYIALLMDLPSLERLKQLINDFIQRATSAQATATSNG